MMKCRDFLIEFEDRNGNLSEAATLHLKICQDCQKTSHEQTQLWLMIDNLQRVDAPADFDFHVKAKIAKAKPADFQPRFFPALRYVLPLGLVVLILGAIAFNASYFSISDSPPIAETVVPQTPIVPNEISPVNSFSANQTIAANTAVELPVAEVAENVKLPLNTIEKRQGQYAVDKSAPRAASANTPKKSTAENDGIRSRDISLTSPDAPRLPLGFEPNRTIEPMPNAGNSSPITDVQILSFIGIETATENGGRKVKAVKPDTLAARSDVRVGDLIEAIDGKRIGGESTQMETSEVKKLTVLRDAKRIEIVLQNKLN